VDQNLLKEYKVSLQIGLVVYAAEAKTTLVNMICLCVSNVYKLTRLFCHDRL